MDRMLGRLGGNASKLLPYSSNNSVVAGATFKADNLPPGAVVTVLEGNMLTWSKSPSNDVIGYRVYRISDEGRTLVSTLKTYEGRRIPITVGTRYVVVAVDITGLESGYSNEVGESLIQPEDKPIEEPEITEEIEETDEIEDEIETYEP